MTSVAGATALKACPAASTWMGATCLAPARLRLLIQLSGPSPTPSHGSLGLTMPQIQSWTDPEMPRMSALAELVDAMKVPATPSRTVTVTTSIDPAARRPRSAVRTRVSRLGAVAIPHTCGAGVTGPPPRPGFLSSPGRLRVRGPRRRSVILVAGVNVVDAVPGVWSQGRWCAGDRCDVRAHPQQCFRVDLPVLRVGGHRVAPSRPL